MIDSNSVADFSELRSLRRYTNLAAAMHVLLRKKLTLLEPANWDDKNDRYYVERYRVYKKLQSIVVLCFARAPETYHHWRVFSPGTDGVCIEFEADTLIEKLEQQGVQHGPVVYRTINDLRDNPPSIEELPFLKRYPYTDECEYRVLFEASTEAIGSKEFDIDHQSIRRIHLSPWMPVPLADAVKEVLRSIQGCAGILLNHSKLIDYAHWKDFAPVEAS